MSSRSPHDVLREVLAEEALMTQSEFTSAVGRLKKIRGHITTIEEVDAYNQLILNMVRDLMGVS